MTAVEDRTSCTLLKEHLKPSFFFVGRAYHFYFRYFISDIKKKYLVSEENGSDLVFPSILCGFCGHFIGKDGIKYYLNLNTSNEEFFFRYYSL